MGVELQQKAKKKNTKQIKIKINAKYNKYVVELQQQYECIQMEYSGRVSVNYLIKLTSDKTMPHGFVSMGN